MNEQTLNTELLNFADNPEPDKISLAEPWKILVVDDDVEIHQITKMVLDRLLYKSRGVKIINAYSGEQSIRVLHENPDIAIVLLDVVMETENAGLVVAKKIREELNYKEIRIILRTGHPGYAPENKIIIDYDINDYKEKTELTSQKLVTSVISALRSYEDFIKIRDLNLNLENLVLERTKELEKTNAKLQSSFKKIHEDLEAGKRIQFRLLPVRDKVFGKYQFSRFLIPSLYLSGDFVDYFQIDDTSVGFYFADVCGHGASSAFITVLLKSLVDNYIRDNDTESRELLKNPAKFLKVISNQILSENLDKHLTLFYGVLDQNNNVLTFAHGGQFPHPIIHNGSESFFLDHKGGMPLGLYKEAEYYDHTINLDEEFVFVVFSDGILEILPQDSLIGRQNYLLSKINSTKFNNNDILEMFELKNRTELQDDIAFLIIKR